MFLGIDWTQVNWNEVLQLLVLSAVLSVVVLAGIRFLAVIPAQRKSVFYLFALLIIWVPIGLITPGAAYGEWLPASDTDTYPGLNYLPQGLASLGHLWKAPLDAYQLPGTAENATLLGQTPGYIASALVGILLVVGVSWLLGRWLAKREQAETQVRT